MLLAAPRGFCAGVRRAVDAVLEALDVHGPPVYVRRPIVHNLEVVRSLEAKGAIFIRELDEAPKGSVVLFSAHGVAPAIGRQARERGLIAYDAVCPLVAKVHREVERHDRNGRQVILIGHAGHPEIEGTAGHVRAAPPMIVNSVEDVAALALDTRQPAAFAIQTTYSVNEAAEIVAALRRRFPDIEGPAVSDICYATTNRQSAVRVIAALADATIVIGERFSSNATRLLEIAASLCPRALLVTGPDEIDWPQLRDAETVGITAAASTPDSAVEAVTAALKSRFRVVVEEIEVVREDTTFKPLAVR